MSPCKLNIDKGNYYYIANVHMLSLYNLYSCVFYY